MSAQEFEFTLAKLYTDSEFLAAFLREPRQTLEGFDLSPQEIENFLRIDQVGLRLAATSFSKKRQRKNQRPKVIGRLWRRLRLRLQWL